MVQFCIGTDILANPHLHAERPLFYLMMLRALLGSLKHPLVLVDWSPVDAPGCFFLLRAAIPLAGRSFVIYERVHEREGCIEATTAYLHALIISPKRPFSADHGHEACWSNEMQLIVRTNANGWSSGVQLRTPALLIP